MTMVTTEIWRDSSDVERRLAELGLSHAPLVTIAFAAIAASADSTAFDPVNAPGTFAYIYGTRALRSAFVGAEWAVDRSDAVEAIRNEARKIKVVFQNVDVACSLLHDPKPRSRKGAGSERICSGNLFGAPLPQYAPRQAGDWATYYLMVDERGAVELTRPVVKSGTFKAYVERIFLSDGIGPDDVRVGKFDDDDAVDGIEPKVARK